MQIPYEVKPREDTGLWNAKLGIWLFLASEVMLFGGLFSAYVFLRTGSNDWPHGWLNVPVGTFNTFVLIGSSITILMAWASLKMRDFKKYKIYMGLTILAGFLFLGVKLGYEYPQKFKHYGITVQTEGGKTIELTGHLVEKTDEFVKLEVDAPKGGHAVAAKEHGDTHGAPAHGEYGPGTVVAEKGAHGHPVVQFPKDQVLRLSNWGPWYHPYLAIYFLLTALHGLHVLGGTLVNMYFWLPGSKMYFTDPEHFANRVEVSGLFWHFVDLVWIFLFPVFYLL
jgi:cytochrome c oxidase subunit III